MAKVSFIQGFLNRLRNKVSRVDLLSSGFGFVISVNDLEDCINYLNKNLQNFQEKELRMRQDTMNYLYSYFQDKIRSQQLEIQQLNIIIQEKNEINQLQIASEVHKKGNNLIYDIAIQRRQAQDIKLLTAGIEHKIRTQLRIEMASEIGSLKTYIQEMERQFADFRAIMAKKVKDDLQEMNDDIQNKIQTCYSNTMSKIQKFQDHNQVEMMPSQDPNLQQSSYNYNFSREKAEQESKLLKQKEKERLEQVMQVNQLQKSHKQEIAMLEKRIGYYQDIFDTTVNVQLEEQAVKKELVILQDKIKEKEITEKALGDQIQQINLEKNKLDKKCQQQHLKIILLEKKLQEKNAEDNTQEIEQQSYQLRKLERLQFQNTFTQNKQQEKIIQLHQKKNQERIKQLNNKLKNETKVKSIAQQKIKEQLPFISLGLNEQNWRQKCQIFYEENILLKKQTLQMQNILSEFVDEYLENPTQIQEDSQNNFEILCEQALNAMFQFNMNFDNEANRISKQINTNINFNSNTGFNQDKKDDTNSQNSSNLYQTKQNWQQQSLNKNLSNNYKYYPGDSLYKIALDQKKKADLNDDFDIRIKMNQEEINEIQKTEQQLILNQQKSIQQQIETQKEKIQQNIKNQEANNIFKQQQSLKGNVNDFELVKKEKIAYFNTFMKNELNPSAKKNNSQNKGYYSRIYRSKTKDNYPLISSQTQNNTSNRQRSNINNYSKNNTNLNKSFL